jgi:N,N'-diacetylchitobiose phosphorylase
LRIDPCIPSHWKEFEVQRIFRGKKITIKVDNSAGVEKGVKKFRLNGELIKDKILSDDLLREENQVEIVMGN